MTCSYASPSTPTCASAHTCASSCGASPGRSSSRTRPRRPSRSTARTCKFGNLPWTPRLGLKADVASGDTDRKDGTLGTFDPLFFRSGYFNDASLYRPSNLMDLHPSLQVSPRESLVLSLATDVLWRYTVNDGVYSPGGNPVLRPNGRGSHYLGTTLEATAEWWVNRHVTVNAAYVYFFGDRHVKTAGGKDVSFLSTTFSFLF